MNENIRTERRFGVTATLSPTARRNILRIVNDEGWNDVLDVMEMCCIEIETNLINSDPAKPTEVLENHKMSKAAWMIFTHLQEKLHHEISLYLASVAPKPLVPDMTRQEQEIENILDPTRPQPDYTEN